MGPRTPEPRTILEPHERQTFHVLLETTCPYLPAKRERKLLTELSGITAKADYDLLSRAGFRRSHRFAYRPACQNCNACVPVRIAVQDFIPSKSLKRIQRANSHLLIQQRPPRATTEQYAIFSRYIRSRHGDGEMASMAQDDYRIMVEDSRLDTRIVEFREPDGRLVAACLADWLADGPSAVYSFFEPELSRQSLGNYMVLALIEAALEDALPHVYLGYWIAQSRKMAYKVRFQPIEGLGPTGWTRLTPPAAV